MGEREGNWPSFWDLMLYKDYILDGPATCLEQIVLLGPGVGDPLKAAQLIPCVPCPRPVSFSPTSDLIATFSPVKYSVPPRTLTI